MRKVVFRSIVIMALATGAAPVLAQHPITLNPGTVLRVKLDRALNSKANRPGDRFTVTVKYGQDDGGLPEGTRIEGVVRESVSSEEGKPGVMDVDFVRIIFPNGVSKPLDGSVIALDNKSVKRNASGRLVASADKGKDRLKMIGVGAGAGLLISTLTRGNTLTSVLLGGAAGYIYNELKNQKPGDVNLKEGSEFGVRLDRPLLFDPEKVDRRLGSRNRDRALEEPDRDPRRRADTLPPDREGQPAEIDRGGEGPEIGLLINDKNIDFGPTHAFMKDGEIMVPLRAVAQGADIDYSYDSNAQMVKAKGGTLKLAVGSRVAMLNGERKRLEAAAEIRNGTLYVPLDFIALALDSKVAWDAPTRTAIITTKKPEN